MFGHVGLKRSPREPSGRKTQSTSDILEWAVRVWSGFGSPASRPAGSRAGCLADYLHVGEEMLSAWAVEKVYVYFFSE